VVEVAVAEEHVADGGGIDLRGQQAPDQAEAAAGVEQAALVARSTRTAAW
jgi:hypothetical protein